MAGAVAASLQLILCHLFLTFPCPFQSFSSSSLPHPASCGLFCPLSGGPLSDVHTTTAGSTVTAPGRGDSSVLLLARVDLN